MSVPLLNRPFRIFVRFYQLTLSHLIGRSCRHHPTCSHYALWQLEKQPLHRALFASASRVLRCNPLFEGGIEYPILPALPGLALQGAKPGKILWWYVPAGNRFLLIKALK